MYNLIKIYAGGKRKVLNKKPYGSYRDAQEDLIDEFRKLYEAKAGAWKDIVEYATNDDDYEDDRMIDYANHNLSILDDIMERVLTDKQFKSYSYDNYTIYIEQI
jgi:hypothetical protein